MKSFFVFFMVFLIKINPILLKPKIKNLLPMTVDLVKSRSGNTLLITFTENSHEVNAIQLWMDLANKLEKQNIDKLTNIEMKVESRIDFTIFIYLKQIYNHLSNNNKITFTLTLGKLSNVYLIFLFIEKFFLITDKIKPNIKLDFNPKINLSARSQKLHIVTMKSEYENVFFKNRIKQMISSLEKPKTPLQAPEFVFGNGEVPHNLDNEKLPNIFSVSTKMALKEHHIIYENMTTTKMLFLADTLVVIYGKNLYVFSDLFIDYKISKLKIFISDINSFDVHLAGLINKVGNYENNRVRITIYFPNCGNWENLATAWFNAFFNSLTKDIESSFSFGLWTDNGIVNITPSEDIML